MIEKKDSNIVSIPMLSINPDFITRYNIYEGNVRKSNFANLKYYETKEDQEQRLEQEREKKRILRLNNPEGEISIKAKRRMKKAISWICDIVPEKSFYCKFRKKEIDFRVNFITLTLPSAQSISQSDWIRLSKKQRLNFENFSDIKTKTIFFQDKILKGGLNNLLTQLRNKYSLHLYLWKAETQKNGNLHFHIITDTYIDHSILREKWNNILSIYGFVQKYTEKHKNLTFENYIDLYPVRSKESWNLLSFYEKSKFKNNFSKYIRNSGFEDRKRQYQNGIQSQWKNPNTTDIHKLDDIDNIFKYFYKYLANNQKGDKNRKIQGKIWGLSQDLSKIYKNNCQIMESDQTECDIQKLKKLYKYNTLDYAEVIYCDSKSWTKKVSKDSLLLEYFENFKKFYQLKIYDPVNFLTFGTQINKRYFFEKEKKIDPDPVPVEHKKVFIQLNIN